MISQISEGITGFIKLNNKLNHLLLLAVSSTAFAVVSLTTGSSLFITNAGPQYLPISYVLMGLISIPIYSWLSQIVDRTSKTQLSRHLLIIAIFLVIVLRFLVKFNHLSIYYIIYIGSYFQWILVTEVLFPSLVADYFTSGDWKNYTTYLRMAIAIGGLLGGLITSLLAGNINTINILLFIPCLYVLVFIQLIYLENNERPLPSYQEVKNSETKTKNKKLVDSLKEYPIIFFLASSTFLFIFLYTFAEFQYLNIYSHSFTHEHELTIFLGIMRIINNIIPLIILYFFTRPLINRLGVVRMNLIYPLTVLASFTGLAFNFNLPMAVVVNLNSDSLDDSINQPVYNLNYNAVPYNLVGQVRTISNGLFYAIGLATAGISLWILQSILTTLQITIIAIIFASIFFFVRYFMGKSYLQSLVNMLRSGSVKLEEVSEGLSYLPDEYNREIEELLTSEDRHDQILGLELASRVSNPSIFITQIDKLLFAEDETVRTVLVQFLSQVSHPVFYSYLTYYLDSDNYSLQLISLEALISRKHCLQDAKLRQLLRKTFFKGIKKIVQAKIRAYKEEEIQNLVLLNNKIKALICLAVSQFDSNDLELMNACDRIWHSGINQETKLLVIRTIQRTKDRNLIPLVQQLLTENNSSNEVKREGLHTLAYLANSEDLDLANIALTEIANKDPLVSASAFKLLGAIRSPHFLSNVALGLENNNLTVRLCAITALANYGEQCLTIAEKYLNSSHIEVVEAAIAVIAKVKTRRAIKILYNYLKPDYQLVTKTTNWLKEIPAYQYPWQLVKIIIEDFQEKLLHRVLYVISRLNHQESLPNIQQILRTEDIRLKANAVETLSSFKYRDFILPILPLLENNKDTQLLKSNHINFNSEKFLEEINNISQRWLNIAGILVLAHQNKTITLNFTNNSDLIVKKVATYFDQPIVNLKDNFFLHRIFFLKKIHLFEKLFLDELFSVNEIIQEQQFVAGSIICNSDNLINDLYIIYRGNALIFEDSQVKELQPGQYFGEIALFDYIPLTVKIMAQTNCSILIISRNDFNVLVEVCPRLLLCYSQYK